ncbi:hypothetical protein H9C73_13995 [Marinobacterium sp. AK62]|uniref:Uncharacterized protein n=1 Tax=Marinobacterium alkalitolerans TaxID=1542925 RepID=A0ABS3ZDR4_9GAMM|nr:hypothetical protein [Marinobacterium alkalitolerans]MBP0049840.1 hypothetical protein [Marinobacterium alkalitolerans]
MTAQLTLLTPAEYHQAESDRLAAMQDYECIFAMFSEVAAESCRLAVQGVDINCEVNPIGLYLVICAPVPTGPLCVRNYHVDAVNAWHDVGRGHYFPGVGSFRSDMCVTDRYTIHFGAPLSQVEPAIETILRRFALMDRNTDACRVMGVAA